MINLMFVLMFSCAKQAPLNHITAKQLFVGNNCLETLKSYMKESGCEQLKFITLGEYDMMMRCYKPEDERRSFWDNYVFRISSPHHQYDIQSKALIDSHTICLDEGMRIEAYPPKKT